MNYLITGITGFAGAHLANLLHEEGHGIYGLTRRSNGMQSDILDVVSPDCFDSINFIYGDLIDLESLKKCFETQFDGVFHLAAQSNPPISLQAPLDTFKTNIMGSANLIEAMSVQPDCRLMFCSTSEVMGNGGKDGHVIKETEPLQPSNPYGVSKAAIDLYVQERVNNGKLKAFITRAFSHTGPRRGMNFSISSDAYQIAKIMNGGDPILEIGNLETTRVVIDVRDVVKAYYLLMKNDADGVFNVCGDVPRKMSFFTDFLIGLSGKKIEKKVSKKYFRPIDIYYQHGDSTKLKNLTGWKPEIPIEKTLTDLLTYWISKQTHELAENYFGLK